MRIDQIYDLLESHLDNCTGNESKKKMKRTRLPIPEEYGGGVIVADSSEAAVRKLLARLNVKPRKSIPTFSDCFDKWFEIKSGQERSPSTIQVYKYLGESHLKPFFEGKKMDEISPDDIQLFYNSIIKLSRSISTQCKAILNGVFERAERNGWIDDNPMRFKYERSMKKGEKIVLQDDDLISVINNLDKLLETGDIRDYLYMCFLCFTALRRGEILGLRWGDIDFESKEIHIQNNVTFPNGSNSPVVREPKDGSVGIVHLSSLLEDKIKKYKGKTENYVFPYSELEKTRPMTKGMFSKMWYRITAKIDTKGATSHSFRASYASMMNAHCDHIDPKVLQGALRHKTPDLAIKVYTKNNVKKTRQAEIEYDAYLCKTVAR